MTKAECRARLKAGETLDSILRFTQGQDCMIYKAEKFELGDAILYVPDIDLNGIPVDEDLRGDELRIACTLAYCYTGNDFLEECDGDLEFAKELFRYVDWQHPSSAAPELFAALEEEREYAEKAEK